MFVSAHTSVPLPVSLTWSSTSVCKRADVLPGLTVRGRSIVNLVLGTPGQLGLLPPRAAPRP